MPPRKRFSAFEDLAAPATPASPAQPTPAQQEIREPAAAPRQAAERVERIERLVPSQMLPDRFQPRRLLPMNLRQAFFSGTIDCYEAAAEWLALADQDPAVRAEVDRLLMMGSSFDEHGQIKPITGSWKTMPDGQFRFLIETGERRFWAACLQKVLRDSNEEPWLRVEVVPEPTRQRQVLENRHAEPPSAVEQACEVASLILSELGISPSDDQEDEYDYFRQARSQRMPVGLWEKVIPVMQLARPRMVQLLNILQLPSHLLEIADRYRLPERVLREVLSLPQDQWERMLRSSIQHQLTSDEVNLLATRQPGLAAGKQPLAPRDPSRQSVRSLQRFARVLYDLDPETRLQVLEETADTLVVNGTAEEILRVLDELAELVQARLKRK